MRRYRTTLDGVNFFLTPELPEPKRKPRLVPRRMDKRRAASQFQMILRSIDDGNFLEPQDLKDNP